MKPAGEMRQQRGRRRHQYDGQQRAGQLFGYARSEHYHQQRHQAGHQRHRVDEAEIGEQHTPLGQKLSGQVAQAQTEEVIDLGGEDGQGDTGGKAHHDGIRYKLDDRAQPEDTHQYQYQARHGRGHRKAGEAILGYYIIYDYDKRARRAAYLHRAAAEKRHHETADDGGHHADGGAHARCDTESDGKRQSHDADHDAGDDVGAQALLGVMLQRFPQLGARYSHRSKTHIP